MEYVCQICMDIYNDKSKGTECAEGHFLCDECLNPYLTQNVFPNLHSLKRNKCAVGCPVINCSCNFDVVPLYGKMNVMEKKRYLGIVNSLDESESQLSKLRSVYQDVLTLKCPTCHVPVDPFPDACSAIMCLNCGQWYCNYCFRGFSDDRSGAHIHVASHHTRADNPDAFLPPELVSAGQHQLQKRLLIKCVSLAMTSKDHGECAILYCSLSLILIADDLCDLNIDISEIWFESLKLTTQGGAVKSSTQPAQLTSVPVNVDGSHQLASAMKTQNLMACQQIMQSFKDSLNCNYIDDESGHSLTALALLYRYKSIVVQLLRRGADPMIISPKVNRTAFYIAVETGMLDVVKLILDLHPNIDIDSSLTSEMNKYNALHVAARYNHGHIVKFLLDRGADMSRKEGELGYTPILLALIFNHSWASRELIARGCKLNESGSAGRTSLFILAEKGQVDILSLVLQESDVARCDVNAPVASNGMRLLHVAAFYGQPHAVSLLLSLKARLDIDCREDEFGYTALGLAVLGKHISCCLLLLNAKANAKICTKDGKTPLFLAMEKLPEVVEDLVTVGGVCVNTPTTSGAHISLPLTLAVIHRRHHLISTLLKLGADVHAAESCNSMTALMQAVLLEDYFMVKMLLESGAVPNQPSVNNRTPLYAAVERGSTAIIHLLVEDYNVNINEHVTFEESGGCALHIAALVNNANATNSLLVLGADITALDKRGRTPIDIAKSNPTSPVLQLLLEHQSSIVVE